MLNAFKSAATTRRKHLKRTIREIKANPYVSGATTVVCTAAAVTSVVASYTIVPAAKAAGNYALAYAESGDGASTYESVMQSLSSLPTAIGRVNLVGVAEVVVSTVAASVITDPNSIEVRGQGMVACDVDRVEMFDHEMDHIESLPRRRTTLEEFAKRPSAGVTDDGLEDVDLYTPFMPDTRATAKCGLDPSEDWELVDPEDECDSETEAFHNERLYDSGNINQDGEEDVQDYVQDYYDNEFAENGCEESYVSHASTSDFIQETRSEPIAIQGAVGRQTTISVAPLDDIPSISSTQTQDGNDLEKSNASINRYTSTNKAADDTVDAIDITADPAMSSSFKRNVTELRLNLLRDAKAAAKKVREEARIAACMHRGWQICDCAEYRADGGVVVNRKEEYEEEYEEEDY